MENINKIIAEIKNKKNELSSVKKKPLVLKESLDILDIVGFDKIFKEEFSLFNNTELIKTVEWNYYYYTLLYYFFSKDNFFNSPLLINKYNDPSFFKGLFIMGNTGIGKTCLLKTFSHMFYKYCNHNTAYHFKIISSIKLTTEFEGLQNSYE
jgi:predicted ATPase